MVKKLLIVVLSCSFFVLIRGSSDPQYDYCGCQAYSEEPKEQDQIIVDDGLQGFRNLKTILNSVGEKIQNVMVKNTPGKVGQDIFLMVKAFILRFEKDLLYDQRERAARIHLNVANDIAQAIIKFDVSRPDLIAKLTELIWKHMREVFDESVHQKRVKILHKCITHYFIPQPREEKHEEMITSVPVQPQKVTAAIQAPSESVHEEKKINSVSEQKQVTPQIVSQVAVGTVKSKSLDDGKKTEEKAQPATRPALKTVVAEYVPPNKKKKKKDEPDSHITACSLSSLDFVYHDRKCKTPVCRSKAPAYGQVIYRPPWRS